MKKILKFGASMFAILGMIFALNLSNVQATYYPNKSEGESLLTKVPNEIVLNIKESEFEKAEDEIEKKVKEIVGRNDISVSADVHYIGHDIEYIDLKEGNVSIVIDNGFGTVNKDITIKYSNSDSYNEKDKQYVEEKTKNINFHRRWDYEINPDGTFGDISDRTNFNWTSVVGDSGITAIGIASYEGASWLQHFQGYNVFIFKNDVLYKVCEGSMQETARVTIPDSVADTDEAYINYAKPIIEKGLSVDDEYSKETAKVETIKRESADFTAFEIHVKTSGINKNDGKAYEDEYDDSIIIAKKDEYRCKIVPTLLGAEFTEKNIKTYLKAKLNIIEVETGFNTYVAKDYPPKITLVSENGNKVEAIVSADTNSRNIYYIEVELDKLASQNYLIKVMPSDTNNKYPSDNIYATLGNGASVNLSSISASVKSVVNNNQLKLNVVNSSIILGDVDGSKKIDINDAILILKHITGKAKLAAASFTSADVTKDSKVDIQDAITVLKYIVGKIKSF